MVPAHGWRLEWARVDVAVARILLKSLGAQSHFLSAEPESEINRQRHDFAQFDLSTGPSQISPNGQSWQATALRQCHGQRGIPTLPRPISPAQPGFNLHLQLLICWLPSSSSTP